MTVQDVKVTPSSPDTAWLFESGDANMPPGEGAAFANGYRKGREEAAAEIERLRAALKPFADAFEEFQKEHVECFSFDTPDITPLMLENDEDGHNFHCTVGDFRRARDVIGTTLEQSASDGGTNAKL